MPILYQLGRALVNSPQRNCVPTVKKGGRLPLPIRAGNRYARRQFSSRIWSISIYNTALYAAHKKSAVEFPPRFSAIRTLESKEGSWAHARSASGAPLGPEKNFHSEKLCRFPGRLLRRRAPLFKKDWDSQGFTTLERVRAEPAVFSGVLTPAAANPPKDQEGEQKAPCGRFLRGETLSRGFPGLPSERGEDFLGSL